MNFVENLSLTFLLGTISDMAETKAALVALSKKPVSVVLVSLKL